MAKYRKKPVVVEAFHLPERDESFDVGAFDNWCEQVGFNAWTSERDQTMNLVTLRHTAWCGYCRLHGVVTAEPGDWIVQDVSGHFYPCKPDIFQATYEPVSEVSEDYLIKQLGEMKAINYHDGPFKAGWDTAIEEVEARLHLNEADVPGGA